MVQPYNYLMGGGGPIQAALGGLRIGASMAEMEAARAVQLANEQAKLEAVRQRDRNQQRFRELINLPRQMTVAESAEAASLVNEQAGGIIRDSVKNLPEQQQFASAGRIGRLISAAQNAAQDKRYIPFFDSLMAQSIEAETDPAQKKALQDLQQFARISNDPTKVANFGIAMMEAAGGKYSEIAKAIHERSKGVAPPEKVQVVQWLEKATPEQRKLFNQVFPANVADLSPQQQLDWYRNLSEGDRTLYDQMRGAGRTPLVQNVLPGQPTPPTEFEKALDNKASQVYTNWALDGGAASAAARIAQLDKVATDLEKSATGTGPTLTGVQIQVIPEVLRPLLVPRSVEARQNAERVIQEGLRPILGAQFTQVEGENFLKRAFDTALGADRNARRLRLILEQMKASAKQAQSVADYFEKNGSMRGFKGVYPSLAQFEAVLAKDTPPAAAAQPQTGAVATPAPGGAVGAAITRRVEIAPRDAPAPEMRRLTPPSPAPAGAAPAARRGTNIGGGFQLLD